MDKKVCCGVNMSSVLGEEFREYFRGVPPALPCRTCWSCFSVLGPRCLTCVCWEVGVEEGERSREWEVRRGEEEEEKKEDERDIGRGIRTGERRER